MVTVGEKLAKGIIQKSGIGTDTYCVNPYAGCTHDCVYCYASFMRRFSGHSEQWGQYVDAKTNAATLFPAEFRKLKDNSTLFFGSVTDGYQPIEKKYRLMRGMLEYLAQGGDLPLFRGDERNLHVSILTKSDLVLRDLDLLREIEGILVGFSIALLNEKFRKVLEPGAPSAQRRLDAMRVLHEAGVGTFLFISPFLPFITPMEELFEATRGICDKIMLDSLNLRCGNASRVMRVVEDWNPRLGKDFREAVRSPEYWRAVDGEFEKLAKSAGIPCESYISCHVR